MPSLVSPGVSVSVTDESFFASSGPGTVPLLFICTETNKFAQGDTNAFAPGTLKENAGELYLITSQRELIQTFGEPNFHVIQGAPQHGNELNEYGLFAAYSYLGIANRAFVMRGDVNLAQMDPTEFEPTQDPPNGTHWLSLGETGYGVFRSNGANNAPLASSFLDFDLGTVGIVDRDAEAEVRVISTTSVSSPAANIITGPGDLVINGTTITFGGPHALSAVVIDINTAAITDVEADIWYTAKGHKLVIRWTGEGDLDFAGTDSSIDTDIGLPGTSAGIDQSPAVSWGDTGDFAIVALDNMNRIYEKIVPADADGNSVSGASAEWNHVGTDDWREALPSLLLGNTNTPVFSGTDTLDITVTLHSGTTVTTTVPGGAWASVADVVASVVADGAIAPHIASEALDVSVDGTSGAFRFENRDGGSITLGGTNVAAAMGVNTPVKAREVLFADHTSIPDNTRAGTVWIKTSEPNNGADWKIKVYNDEIRQWIEINVPLYEDNAFALAEDAFGASPAAGVIYIQYDPSASSVAEFLPKRWNGTSWDTLTYEPSVSAPKNEAEEGTLWYNDQFEVDIMVGDGTQWLGLNNHPWYLNSDIILNGSKPTQKPVGSPNGSALVENDIWIETSDLENYPKVYRYRANNRKWELIDNTDQTTPFGVVFADARWDDGTGLQDTESFANSNIVDPDAPNPLTYPNGMLLFNTRFSTLNVKEWQPEALLAYTETELLSNDVIPAQYEVGLAVFQPIAEEAMGRWVTASGNQVDGAPWSGRKAQRQMAVRAMASAVIANQDIRAESVFFNLLAAPGYPELIDEMVTLNTDKKEWAFIVADTPARLTPDGTSIQNWATNVNNAPSNGDLGLTTGNTYVGLYYPWGLSTNLDGNEIMISPSTIALRTIAFNDNVAYQWFAPAGFNRGMVTNAASVGYLDATEQEYRPVILNNGQRDVLYLNKINPIAFMPGQGLVVWGQKTLHPVASALDRINVVRLINYLRYQFDILAKPFLFEPNDKQTRDSVKVTFERFLSDLIALRALYDFAVICDESNNTGIRIDRNELWVDVAIKPIKAIEFIYIPIRVLNTDDELPS